MTIIRLIVSLLGFAAIITEIAVLQERSTFDASNFFSYFTILSNIFIVAILLVSTTKLKLVAMQSFQYLRGAATLYIAMTGVIFSLLLSGLENVAFTATEWDNLVLHYLIPLYAVIDWVLFKPPVKLRLKRSLLWLAGPILYVLYTLIRGSVTGWYPYPFLNIERTGVMPFLVTIVLLAIATVVGTWLLTLRRPTLKR